MNLHINRPYVRNHGKVFTPIYMPGERYSFYCQALLSENASFRLSIINANTTDILWTYGSSLSKVFVAGSVGYNLYLQNFVFPLIESGQYYFSIISESTGNEKARSNIFICTNKCLDTTSYIEFRHNDQLFGVRYDLLPDFWQKFRLPINEVKSIEITAQRDEYRKASGEREIVLSKSFRDIKQTLELYWANADDFEAVSAALEHSCLRINGTDLILLDQVKVELPSDFSVQYKGTFTVIAKDREQQNYMPEGIARGGNTPYIYNNFLRGNL